MAEICVRTMVEPRGIEPLTSTMPLYSLPSESAEMRGQALIKWRNMMETRGLFGTDRNQDPNVGPSEAPTSTRTLTNDEGKVRHG